MRHTAAAFVLLASPAFAQTTPPREGPITCASPVAPDDTERTLKQRFGKDAVVQDLPGAEGEKYKGLVLFPKARDRRIEIAFTDDKAMTLLPAEALGLGDGDALKADFLKRFLHLVELEWLDDGFDFLHCAPPGLSIK